MVELDVDLRHLDVSLRDPFRDLVRQFAAVAGDALLGLAAFGGRVHNDPLFRLSAACSVAVLSRFDLTMLERIASAGVRLGRAGLAAPLIMTPDYILASRDSFPLELLEIQRTQILLRGEDYFSRLTFEAADVRLQCEREMKSELMLLRQGLLAAAGNRRSLTLLLTAAAERAVRILRGVLHLSGAAAPAHAGAVVAQAAGLMGTAWPALTQVAGGGVRRVDVDYFKSFYAEVTVVADWIERWSAHGAGVPSAPS